MLPVSLLDIRPALSKLDDRRPAVRGIANAPNLTLRLQPVHECGDAARRHLERLGEIAHPLRAVAVEGIEQAKPGQTRRIGLDQRTRPALERKREVAHHAGELEIDRDVGCRTRAPGGGSNFPADRRHRTSCALTLSVLILCAHSIVAIAGRRFGGISMRAFAINEFGAQGSVRELPDPEPGDGQVRVRVEAAAVNPADVWMASGAYK